MKSFDKLSKALLALLVLVALPLGDLLAQNFIMQTGGATYNATCNGVIKMKNAGGQIQALNSNPLGTATEPIEGAVDWAATTGTQTVQGLYYEKMIMTGGANKTVATGVYIVGAACPSIGNGYDFTVYPFYIDVAQLATVNDFQGTFNYIGAGQTTFPVTGDDAYNNLALDGSNHIIPVGTTTVEGTITLPTGPLALNGVLNSGLTSTLLGIVNINNGGTWNIGTGDITYSANVNVANGGTLNGGAGDIIIGASSTLALAGSTAIVDLDATEEMFITGAFTNAGDGTNLSFDCASTVTYNGTTANQLILPTITSNPYGILTLTSSSKRGGTATYGNNVEICGNFSLSGGNLDMVTNGGYVNMLDQTSTATYAGLNEVVGAFRRQYTTTATGPYTYNNSGTLLTFTEAPDAAGYYQLFVEGSNNPRQFDNSTDVNRTITPTYASLGNFTHTIQAAYLATELPGTWATDLGEANLKFFESDNSAIEKVAGTSYTRTPAGAGFGLLSLGDISNGTGAVDGNVEKLFTSGNDLVLRASNTMISIANGRWTNPGTWDEGRVPNDADNVDIRTLVYVGIDGPFAGTDATGNTTSETSIYSTNAAARTILISQYEDASLVIGNEDNAADYVHKTLFNGTSFVNNNTLAATNILATTDKTTVAPLTQNVNGLFLLGLSSNTGIPSLGTAVLQNSGAIQNAGVIEIGN